MDAIDGGISETALAEAFADHRERLWRTVRVRIDRRLLGRIDPDDILQEAYLDAARRRTHYRADQGSVFLWLRLVVAQTLADTHRRHLGSLMRDAGREVSGGMWPDATSAIIAGQFVDALTPPSQAAIRAEMAQKIEAALEAMPAVDREVLVLRHFEELTNGEVAQVLSLQPKAASIRYIRAMARLKTILEAFPDFANDWR